MGRSTVRNSKDAPSTDQADRQLAALRAGDPPDLVVQRRDLNVAGFRSADQDRRQPESRAVIADVHAITRHGMRALLELCGNVEVVAEASSATEAVQAVCEQVADLAVLGFDLRDSRTPLTLRRIKHEAPFTRVLVLSGSQAQEDVLPAIEAGASGYLSKSASPREFKAAVDALRAGGMYLDAGACASMRSFIERSGTSKTRSRTRLGELTEREMEVARLVAEGLTARRIASQLGISDRTVNSHVGNLYRRLGVNNRVDAVRELMRIGVATAPR